jgi:hypothetical protein
VRSREVVHRLSFDGLCENVAYLGEEGYDIDMKKFLISAAVLMVVVPQIAMAAWWNPVSWFETATSTLVMQEPIGQQNDENKDSDSGVKELTQGDNQKTSVVIVKSPSKSQYDKAPEQALEDINKLRQEIQSLKISLDAIQKSHSELLASIKKNQSIDNMDVDGINKRLSNLENRSPAKNYDSQIAKMSEYINALLHATTLNDGNIRCTIGYTLVSLKGSYPECASVYSDLSY